MCVCEREKEREGKGNSVFLGMHARGGHWDSLTKWVVGFSFVLGFWAQLADLELAASHTLAMTKSKFIVSSILNCIEPIHGQGLSPAPFVSHKLSVVRQWAVHEMFFSREKLLIKPNRSLLIDDPSAMASYVVVGRWSNLTSGSASYIRSSTPLITFRWQINLLNINGKSTYCTGQIGYMLFSSCHENSYSSSCVLYIIWYITYYIRKIYIYIYICEW